MGSVLGNVCDVSEMVSYQLRKKLRTLSVKLCLLRIVTSFTSVLCAVKEVVFIRDNGLLSKCEFIFYG